MLFGIKYSPAVGRTSEQRRQVWRLAMAWEPRTGVEIQAHYHFVSGGGVIVVETTSASALYESLEPFKPLVQFDVEPVVNVIEAIATSMDVDEWVASTLAGYDSEEMK
jgi:hypothetical protein